MLTSSFVTTRAQTASALRRAVQITWITPFRDCGRATSAVSTIDAVALIEYILAPIGGPWSSPERGD